MSEPRYFIQNGKEYLISYNGGDEWEWTDSKKWAWWLKHDQAAKYLHRMNYGAFPLAVIVPANKAAKKINTLAP